MTMIVHTCIQDDPANTVGTLDLGGGSMQIACRPTGSSDIPNEGEYNVQVAGNEYGMYAISHLSYGLMQARRRVDALVRARYVCVCVCMCVFVCVCIRSMYSCAL
jgi:Golgi nucleoside diphosphatase